jgi:hypothetical protein
MARLRHEHHRCSATATAPVHPSATAPSRRSARPAPACRRASIEFRPTLQRQRDHAAERDQTHRAALFDRLLTDLEQEAS